MMLIRRLGRAGGGRGGLLDTLSFLNYAWVFGGGIEEKRGLLVIFGEGLVYSLYVMVSWIVGLVA